MRPLYVYLSISVWAIFAFGIAYFARKKMKKGLSEFFIENRKVGGFISGMTYSATTYSAFMMIGLVGLVYSSGVAALGFELTYLIFTVFLLYIFAPRFWIASREHDYITPPELLSDRYENKYTGIIATIIALTMLIPYASVQLMGAGYLFQGLTNGEAPYIIGVLVMSIFSGVTAYWAGFRSVSWTDAFQALTMLISSIILLFYVFFNFFESPIHFFTEIQATSPDLLKINWDFRQFIGLTLPWAFFALSNPQVSQRMFVSKNISSLKRMIIYFSIFGLIYTIITTLLGFSIAHEVPGLANADTAMPELLSRAPTILGLLVFVGIFAAATSTLGSIVLTLSSLGVMNIASSLKPDLSENNRLIIGKTTIPILIIICILFASLQLDLIAVLSSMASGGLLVTVPTFIGAFFWSRGTAKGAIWSMIIGGITTAMLYITGWYPYGWWPSVWGFGISISLFIIISLYSEKPSKADDFLKNIEKKMNEYNF